MQGEVWTCIRQWPWTRLVRAALYWMPPCRLPTHLNPGGWFSSFPIWCWILTLVLPTNFLHQEARIWSFFCALRVISGLAEFSGIRATCGSHVGCRDLGSHTANMAASLWARAPLEPPGPRAGVQAPTTHLGASSTQPWPHPPQASWFSFLFSGDYSLMDTLSLVILLIPTATGIPSPGRTCSVWTWEASQPRRFFYPAKQHWHRLSFPIQISGQPGLSWHNWLDQASWAQKSRLFFSWSQPIC